MTVIEVDKVHKTYPGVIALEELTFGVEAGEIVAILGSNGAGKSTMFEILTGLIHPTSGAVQVLGSAPGTQKHRIGVMLQNSGLPDAITVKELVRLIGRSYPKAHQPEAMLDQVSLSHRAGQTVSTLSGGERQRLMLATALIGEPELLLLDEPTAAMDVASKRAFWARARASVDGGATLVFATHDLHEASTMADRVIVIDQGRVVADASPDELTHHGDENLEEVFLALTQEVSNAATGGK